MTNDIMHCIPTEIPEVLLITPRVFQDSRGFFMETFRQLSYAQCGIPGPFVQDNYSHSHTGILRGMHYQLRRPQGKLISVIRGEIFDVAVDVRVGSPTFGRWVGQTLSDRNRAQMYVPPGFAHGFAVLSESVDVIYKCTDYYVPDDERGLLWSDHDLGIAWPSSAPIVSERDRRLRCLRDIPREDLPVYRA